MTILLALLLSFAQAQFDRFGKDPPLGGGSGMSSTTGKGASSCKINSYSYHPEYGFGFFVEKSAMIHDLQKTEECMFYNIKTHGYATVNRYKMQSAQSCISDAKCERIGKAESRRVVSVACPPFELNGQEIVGVRDLGSDDRVEILIRSQVPAAIGNQTDKARDEQEVRKSAYVVQTLSKTYFLDSNLRGQQVKDLSDTPSSIYTQLNNKINGIYITSKCDPEASGPVSLFGPEDIGPFGVGGAIGVPGVGMTPPSRPKPVPNGAK